MKDLENWYKRCLSKYSVSKILLLMLIPIFLFIVIAIVKNRQLRRYKLVEFDKSYFFTVHKMNEYRGELFLNDSISIGAAYDNGRPYPNFLHDYLMMGDSIAKKVNSDSIIVFRSGFSNRWFIHHSK